MRCDEVIRAITFSGPAYVPLRIYDDFARSDIVEVGFDPPEGWAPAEPGETEWGYRWEQLDQTMGQVKRPAFDAYEEWWRRVRPDPLASGRFRTFARVAREWPDRYLMGSLGISGFNQTTFLRGMDRVFADLYLDRANYGRLLREVAEFEMEIIRGFARAGAHAVSFGDDWGTQRGLMIDPALWREVYKPVYREQFALAHRLGLHVFFHSCGKVNEIIGDLVEIGADMLNFNQVHLLGLGELATRWAGKVCFFMPCDNQRTNPTNDVARIRAEARLLMDTFGRFRGGFIGQCERYASLHFSEEAFEACIDEFRDYGGRLYTEPATVERT